MNTKPRVNFYISILLHINIYFNNKIAIKREGSHMKSYILYYVGINISFFNIIIVILIWGLTPGSTQKSLLPYMGIGPA